MKGIAFCILGMLSTVGLVACGGSTLAKEGEPGGAGASAGAGDPSHIANPTGDCTAPGDGYRERYHSPGPDAVWLVDCNNPLEREYWRVFARSAESASVMPRPDGAPYWAEVCSDAAHPLHTLVAHYALCSLAADREAVDRINDMRPEDALKLTHFLHQKLEFRAGGDSIVPFAIAVDILDACALDPMGNSPEFKAICEREQERFDSGYTIGFTYEGPGAVELAARLNQLYGVQTAGGE